MLQGKLIPAFQYVSRAYKQEGGQLFTWSDSNRTRGDGFNLKKWRFWLDIQRKIFTQRVKNYLCWSRLPREIVGVPSWDAFKARKDGP